MEVYVHVVCFLAVKKKREQNETSSLSSDVTFCTSFSLMHNLLLFESPNCNLQENHVDSEEIRCGTSSDCNIMNSYRHLTLSANQ